ncbi:MAG: saccharopine dehydrogenase NADP-binding domain-containing protein [Anaerolineales bacterium]|nr:saccharopine dehydrogenase NADP-binding domain-containing protein [Anaerolineales bacterium]
MPSPTFLLYGSYGYTGTLIAKLAVQHGLRPTLAGRDAEKLRIQALALGLDHRPFTLDNPDQVADIVRDYPVVLHCAGPFSQTAQPMAQACLRTGAHYLDITGEITVFETLAGLDTLAQQTGVMLMPGVGFDVVPTDCLALHLKNRLPTATHLALGLLTVGGAISRGTALTGLERLNGWGAVRHQGKITPVPLGHKIRPFDFGRGPRPASAIPWGDVSTAWYSTGIPNIGVYNANFGRMGYLFRLAWIVGPLLQTKLVSGALKNYVRTNIKGPTQEQNEKGIVLVSGEVKDAQGNLARARLQTPEAYQTTALTALATVEKVLAGGAKPGFQTPAKAFGADFILEIEGVKREDLP